MGQRHQIYIVEKNKDGYQALGAWHHQWCFGMRAVTNLHRLVDLLKKNTKSILDGKWCSYNINEVRLLDSAVKSCYGVDIDGQISRVHNETDQGYLIADGVITPENGDNNDGCTLVIIDNVKKDIRAGFFTPGHVEGQYYNEKRDGKFKAWDFDKYLGFYYTKEELLDPDFIKSYAQHINFMVNVCFNRITTQELKRVLKRKLQEKVV